ncbi:MAG: hypothetical protein ACK55I_00595, partial [bacterium]
MTAPVAGTPGGAPAAPKAFDFRAVLQRMIRDGASDLHLKVGRPPTIRVHGDLQPLDLPSLRNEELRELAEQLLPPP